MKWIRPFIVRVVAPRRDTALTSGNRAEAILAAPKPRFVIVHYHIFKNGGSTIESILQREFPRAFATLHGAHASSALDGKQLISFLRRNPEITAVSSHHLRYPKPAVRNTVLFDCCFLRHPLARLDSLYRYLRGMNSPDPLCARARMQSPGEFFRLLMNESPHLVSNVQVTQLACSGEFIRPAYQGDLDRAATRFAEMAIPGVVEMFDESLVAAEYFLKPAFPNVTWEYVPQNVSRAVGTAVLPSSRSQGEHLSNRWGLDTYEDLVQLNQLDLDLFRIAQEEIRRRISLVPGAVHKMTDFRRRCAQLQGQTDLAKPDLTSQRLRRSAQA